jgi:succinate dehydrogenase/fumarate reductase iron-sulfur protein
MHTTFKVSRFDPEKHEQAQFVTYTVDLSSAETVLAGLTHIRDEQDPSLAFRANCERGTCGDCALRVNKKGVLGCTTKVADVVGKDGVVTVEPIRHVPVLKDLVYDMETFLWRKVKAVTPWISPRMPEPEGEYLVSEEAMAKVRTVMSCVMCGLCDEGCTVVAVDDQFVGPAALTKAYRAIFDPRDGRQVERLRSISEPEGVWDCAHCFEANGHCPIGLAPTDRIFDIAMKRFARGFARASRIPKCAGTTTALSNRSKRVAGWMKDGWRLRAKDC